MIITQYLPAWLGFRKPEPQKASRLSKKTRQILPTLPHRKAAGRTTRNAERRTKFLCVPLEPEADGGSREIETLISPPSKLLKAMYAWVASRR